MDYLIKKSDNKIYIAEENNYFIYDMTIQKLLNKTLIYQLNDIKSLEKNTKKLFDFKNKIPLYIDKNTLLICLISFRIENSFYLNYFQISNFYKKERGVIIEFFSHHSLYFKSYFTFKKQYNKAKKVFDFFQVNGFQSMSWLFN